MPSQDFRYYRLDSTGKLHDAEWLAADSDEDAIAQIEAEHPDSRCEIWQGRRLVAKLGSEDFPTAITNSHRVVAKSLQVLRDTAHMINHPGTTASS